MKVNDFSVRWKYDREEGSTTCLIGPAVAKGEEFVPQAEAKIVKYYKDNPCYDTARKMSLSRALQILFPGSTQESKEARFEFWDEYRMLPKTPRWFNK